MEKLYLAIDLLFFFFRKNEIWKKSVGSWLRKKKFFFKTEENSTVYWSFDSTLYEPPESRERKFKCEKCIEEFTSYESRRQHINKDHFFQTIRGIHSKKSKRTKKDHDHYVFVGHDSLLSLQKKYKNTEIPKCVRCFFLVLSKPG